MELVVLDPKRIRLLRDKPGSLLLKREENDPEPIRVKPSRNFPLTDPDHYISLLHEVDEKEEVEMGVIVEPKELESKSQRQLRRVLAKMYFLPVVLKISKITEEFGVLRWEVETDKGPRTFEVRGRDEVRLVTGGHVLIRDIDGNRYHIPGLNDLDVASRHCIEGAL
jgi:hypothetical protein